SAWAAAGCVAPGTVLGAAAAVGTLGTDGVAACALASPGVPEDDSALVAAGGVPKSDGLPLLTCQLFHRSNSEKEKIIQRMVRRISMVPTIGMRADQKRSGKPTSLASIGIRAAMLRAAGGPIGVMQRRYRVVSTW